MRNVHALFIFVYMLVGQFIRYTLLDPLGPSFKSFFSPSWHKLAECCKHSSDTRIHVDMIPSHRYKWCEAVVPPLWTVEAVWAQQTHREVPRTVWGAVRCSGGAGGPKVCHETPTTAWSVDTGQEESLHVFHTRFWPELNLTEEMKRWRLLPPGGFQIFCFCYQTQKHRVKLNPSHKWLQRETLALLRPVLPTPQ